MNWPEVMFETLYSMPSRNGVYKPKQFHGRGTKIVNMGEMFGYDFIANQEMERLELRENELAASSLEDGDLLFGRRSLVESGAGKCSIVVQPEELLTFESSIIRVRLKKDIINPNFLFYYFKSPEGRGRIFSIVTGTNVKGIRGSDLKRLQIIKPDKSVQDKIVSYLSAYDDLIENNRRRIALLEQAARLLYREWFVYLRYPGHEHVRVVDGVPKGWRKSSITDVCNEFTDGDWIETKDQGGEDYRLLQISNIGENEFIETRNYRFISEETYRRLRCNEIVPGDILISRMPTPIGRAWYVTSQQWKMITAVDGTIARPNPEQINPFYFLYHLNSAGHLALCAGKATGTTRPRISRKSMGALPILIPPIPLQNEFGDFANHIIEMRTNLRRQIDQLTKSRDLILPRLMNGEIEV
jgi:type I restriction enzyme, S subunit